MPPAVEGEFQSSRSGERVLLDSLTSIRFFAAVHIFAFHLLAGHQAKTADANSPALLLSVFDALPKPAWRLLERGAYSTPLFFVISGFILTFIYVRPDGKLSIDQRNFWLARLTRIYPLHLIVLVLIAPIMFTFGTQAMGMQRVLQSGVCSVLLIQAWIPPFALSWNFATWALSAVVFFYVCFPWLVGRMESLSNRHVVAATIGCVLFALIPSVLYLYVYRQPDYPQSYNFWAELIMRNPLLWLPHFMAGMAIARCGRISRFDLSWQDKKRRRYAWGDAACLVVLVLLTTNHALPRFLLRHGLLIPLYAVIVHDLAHQRGLVHLLLSWKSWSLLGEASFSIFILQFPAMILASLCFSNSTLPSAMVLGLTIVGTVLASVLSNRFIEQPLSLRLRARWQRQQSA